MSGRERPILFSGPMVRAILAGRKTQTRRVCRSPEEALLGSIEGTSPYGRRGDRLWVRETFATLTGNGHRIVYRADGEPRTGPNGSLTVLDMKWTPSIFMPRVASRLVLDVTGVRAERLQSISQDDAAAEGMRGPLLDQELDRIVSQIGRTPRDAYAALWDSINGKRAPWSSNPLVWAVTFSVERPRAAGRRDA